MNRIYQGRVTKVEFPKSGTPKKSIEWECSNSGESVLWDHHQWFQDAVNYYIVALASLGTSTGSKLTHLRELLGVVWDGVDKKGQRRRGMGESLQRAWQLSKQPTLEEAVERFLRPIREDQVPLATAEKAAEYLLFKLGGEAAIQQGGREFLPMFCDVETTATFKLSASRRGRADDERRLQRELHRDLSDSEIHALACSITLGSVVSLQPESEPDTGEAALSRLRKAAQTFPDAIGPELLEDWIKELNGGFALPKQRGGNINVRRVDACTLFLAFPNRITKGLFQSTFSAPRLITETTENESAGADDEAQFIVDGDDPIKLARGRRGYVFPGFTALPIWRGDGVGLAWKEFDIAAFKEALKVYNQFQQNLKKREEKLDALAVKLLVMDGERAMDGFTEENFQSVRSRLEKIWTETNGKPSLSKNENKGDGEQAVELPCFVGDPRIDRLRRIVNDDLAEEYRLTDGDRTAYGLRRRTMKGWGEITRLWHTVIKKGELYTEEKRQKLKEKLDGLRGGEKREQIGSHKLFEALITDEAAWQVWREPDKELEDRIFQNRWAADPLDAFREYCETRDAIAEVTARPLNFTPADARYSRRLFMFSDVCSFGKAQGEFKHDPREQAVTVPVAVRGAGGFLEKRTCRLTYSAPRLLRDRIRAEDGGYIQDWTQPMMRALFGPQEGKTNPQELADAAVQLMPDFDGKENRRILLNFPLNLDDQRIKARLGKAALWDRQFVSWKKGAQLPFLRWMNDFDGKEPHRWWERLSSFRVLSADLGTRHAASVALIECGKERGGTARLIGRAGEHDWHGHYRSGAILRLPGENAEVLRLASKLDKNGSGKAFREEFHGERGRPANQGERDETLDILEALNQKKLLGDNISDEEIKKRLLRFSFPELNDKLLVAMRRAQNWIAACISWHWKLSQPEAEGQREKALAELREQKQMTSWQALAAANDLAALKDALHLYISTQRCAVQQQLLRLTGRILPLRGRQWEWVTHPEKPDCHLLRETEEGSGPRQVKRYGQRGLSMARIEQLSELRRRWQSLNQSLRRQIGEKPLTAAQMRNDPIPDPCPGILAKLENLREQRVNQTAHLILAQALGLKLCEPKLSPKSRAVTDTHGEYEVARPPVDFIVLEDLSRYLSDQGRAKSENTRLMKWCHRAVTQKVKMLAEPFGIPVLETPAAYSSRFCSLTGIAGFRAAEVGWADREEFRWRVLLDEAEAAQNEGKKPSDNAAQARLLFSRLKEISRSGQPHRTLLAPQPGGPIFITAKAVPHPAPAAARKTQAGKNVLPMQADLNAAANLAFRAVAHPACAEIHHRLRTERKKGARNRPDPFTAREKRRFGNEKVVIEPLKDDLPKERNSNFFWDGYGVAPFGRARLQNEAPNDYPYASGPGVWKIVNDREKQWKRCWEINSSRLKQWDRVENRETDDRIPM